MEHSKLEELQLERLRDVAVRCYENIPLSTSSALMRLASILYHIESLEDIKKFPFTVKQDMRDAYPFGLFAVPRSECVRVHASSGTTGQATVVGYTKDDLQVWGDCFARGISMLGGGRFRRAGLLWLRLVQAVWARISAPKPRAHGRSHVHGQHQAPNSDK